MPTWLIAAAVVLGAGHLLADSTGRGVATGILKPLPVALGMLWAATCPTPVSESYRWLVVVGLIFSMAGDVFLLSKARFVPGLASFLVAHLFYVAAFVPGGGLVWAPLVIVGAVAALLLRVLWPHLGEMRGPVLGYVAVIASMAWQAVVRGLSPATPAPSGVLAALGAVVFMASDTTLALDRFARPFAGAHALVMVTYYAAQLLIAASVGR